MVSTFSPKGLSSKLVKEEGRLLPLLSGREYELNAPNAPAPNAPAPNPKAPIAPSVPKVKSWGSGSAFGSGLAQIKCTVNSNNHGFSIIFILQ